MKKPDPIEQALDRLSALRSQGSLSDEAIGELKRFLGHKSNLVVAKAWVDEGPTLRRWQPRAYGRATKIRKRTSHVTIVVKSLEEEVSGGTQG